VSQPDTAHEILPVDMNWQHGTDFSPRILPADSEENLVSGIAVEDVPDPIGDAKKNPDGDEDIFDRMGLGGPDEGEGESSDDEEAGPKDSPASEPAIVPVSPTPPTKDAF
jgi:hypothetical protein